MFYAHFVLSKKGPLARIWLAAHWDKKLTKAHVFETNIENSVEAIIQPKVKLALRTSGHLLLGVVRIYSRKAKYLLADCNEAFVKIKMAFRPGVVDLPEENREAAVNTITLPETFHDFETTMADLNDIDVQAQFNVNQSRPEEITMREDLGNITLVGDDGFGELGGFGAGADNMLQDVHMDDSLYVRNPDSVLPADHTHDDLGEGAAAGDKEQDSGAGEKPMEVDPFTSVAPAAGAESVMPDAIDDYANASIMQGPEGPAGMDDDDDSDHDDGGDFGGGMDTELFGGDFGETGGLFEEPPPVPEVAMPPPAAGPEVPAAVDAQPSQQQVTADAPGVPGTAAAESGKDAAPEDETHLQDNTTASTIRDQTTLLPNEAEAFALEPIDVTSLAGTERKTKRKRKLIIDDQKGIASETMKMQLSDTSDIITTLDLAPPTKKLMHWKETGGVEKLFALPGRPLVSRRVTKLFNKNLVTRAMSLMEEEQEEQLELEEEHHEPAAPAPPVPEPVPEPIPEETRAPEPMAPPAIPSVTSMVEQPSIRERETARAEQSSIEEPPSMLEPPSLLEDQSALADASRPSISMAGADTSMVSNTTANTTMQPEQLPEVPDLQAPELEPAPLPMSRRSSLSADEDNDPVDLFNEDLPDMDETALSEAGHSSEAEEEAEERRWNKRTQQMSFILNRSFSRGEPTVHFSQLTRANNRKQVASKFYTLLVLKKLQAVDVVQPAPYADIAISQGPKFEALV